MTKPVEKTPASRQLLNITKSMLDHAEAENARLRARDASMRSALAAIANYFEISLGFREGDKEYQVVILAREALKE
jgi:hypothetical protein